MEMIASFFGLVSHKLIAADYPAFPDADLRIDLAAYLTGQFPQTFVSRKSQSIHPGDLSRRVAEFSGIHIMVHGICRQYNVSDIDLCLQRSCDPRIDHSIYMKIICQDLSADPCVYLANA